MRLVVTGAGGLTGGAVARELRKRGHQVIGITRQKGSLGRIPAGVEPASADCSDPWQLEPLLEDADGFVHVAGILLGTALAASISRITRVVVVSTAGVYSRHRSSANLYRENEDAIRRVRPKTLFVRPTMIYGSARDRNIRKVVSFVRRWRALPLPSGGRSILQPIHYADLAAAVAELVESDAAGVVDAGGPEPVTTRHVAESIFHALGLPPILIPVPIAAMLPVATALNLLTRDRWRERVLRLTEDRSVDITRLRELTGCGLRSIECGIRDEVAEITAMDR